LNGHYAVSASLTPGRMLLRRDVWLLAIAAVALLNGSTYSPLFDSILYFMRPAARAFFIVSPSVFFYLTSVVLSLLTVLLAGIPAAIYERSRGLRESTPVSLAIWLAAAVLLALPATMNLFGDT
jgi:hypothetical protein